jgi:molybdate transport system substrate-binding protein
MMRPLIGIGIALFGSFPCNADTLRVGVASNFSVPFKAIQQAYQRKSEHRLLELSGSSGKLFAQIHHGAPIDVFLAADSLRPRQLERQGHALKGSRFTYTVGRLALWTAESNMQVDASSLAGDFHHLAIANPRIAPYGLAAEQVIEHLGLTDTLKGKIVQGENVSQAMHYAASGNAEFSFVGLAQTHNLDGSYWLVPQTLHQPIEQQAIVIRQSKAADQFVAFLKSKAAKTILQDFGYASP